MESDTIRDQFENTEPKWSAFVFKSNQILKHQSPSLSKHQQQYPA